MCGEIVQAPCVEVEYDFPAWSGLADETCTGLDDVVSDIYDEIAAQGIRVEDLTLDCITLPSNPTATDWAQAINDEVCSIDDRVTVLEACECLKLEDFEYDCLLGTDPCGEVITINSVKDLIQVLIDKTCE